MPILGSVATNYTTLQWLTSGTGTFDNAAILHPVYTPSQGDVINGFAILTLTANPGSNCALVSDTMKLTIRTGAVANAGQDAVTCQNTPYTVTGASVTFGSSLLWTHNGLGTLTGATIISPTYTPDPSESGTIVLTLSVTGEPPCGSASDQMNLTINKRVDASAGNDASICENRSFVLSGATGQNFTSVLWTTTGTGSFSDPTTLNPVYTPSAVDLLTGHVILTLTAYGQFSCGNVIDPMTLTFIKAPTANAGPDLATCPGQPVTVSQAVAQNFSSLLWTHNGLGILSDATTISPTYTPAPAEQGKITLTFSVQGIEGCSDTIIHRQMTISISPLILANAGPNQAIPAGTSTRLSGNATGGSGTFAYQWQPATMVLGYTTENPETVILTEAVLFTFTVTDLVTGCKASDTVRVGISSYNLPPVAVDDYDTTGRNIPININILKNDYDPDGKITSVTLCGGPYNGTVILNSDSTLTYSPKAGFTGLDSLCYYICDNGIPVLCDTATVYILVSGDDPASWLIIYNVITPNGDGDNDSWIIDGIEKFPNNSVVIFNRWGDKINGYERYDNKSVVWKGENLHGDLVPDGTYYYILKINDGGSRNGWIFVRRGSK